MAIDLPADTLGLLVIFVALALLFALQTIEARRQKRQADERLDEAESIITAQNVALASIVAQAGGRIVRPVLSEAGTIKIQYEMSNNKPFVTIELDRAGG